jgi:hypothetical protein
MGKTKGKRRKRLPKKSQLPFLFKTYENSKNSTNFKLKQSYEKKQFAVILFVDLSIQTA